MKIAIRGHHTRKKEVDRILENLGGKNRARHTFAYNDLLYYLDSNNLIICAFTPPPGYREYTLEEFEQEFPFKVGDEVIFPIINGWASGKIIGIKDFEYVIKTRHNYHYVEPHQLSLYPMKEERNITLTLDKAKEWYKKGGELREIALQAFTEKELNPLPRSWEEFSYKYKICSTRYAMPSKYAALYQLEQLRNCWWGDWKPEYNCGTKYIIKWDKDDLIVTTSGRIRAFLIFPTIEMAEEFLKCFRDLIEKAGDLI